MASSLNNRAFRFSDERQIVSGSLVSFVSRNSPDKETAKQTVFTSTYTEAQFPRGELATALRPLVMASDRLPLAAVQGAPEPLPGLVMATAVGRGDQVDLIPPFSMGDLGGADVVWATAKQNVKSLHGIQIGREPLDPSREDTDVVYLWGEVRSSPRG